VLLSNPLGGGTAAPALPGRPASHSRFATAITKETHHQRACLSGFLTPATAGVNQKTTIIRFGKGDAANQCDPSALQNLPNCAGQRRGAIRLLEIVGSGHLGHGVVAFSEKPLVNRIDRPGFWRRSCVAVAAPPMWGITTFNTARSGRSSSARRSARGRRCQNLVAEPRRRLANRPTRSFRFQSSEGRRPAWRPARSGRCSSGHVGQQERESFPASMGSRERNRAWIQTSPQSFRSGERHAEGTIVPHGKSEHGWRRAT
jgi:hypothetical protein